MWHRAWQVVTARAARKLERVGEDTETVAMQPCPLLELPEELLERVLLMLHPLAFGRCAQACVACRAAASSNIETKVTAEVVRRLLACERVRDRLCSKCPRLVLPESAVTAIPDCAFRQCASLVSIIMPASVKRIGDYAFSACDSLTTVVLPDTISVIGDHSFAECRSLTALTIPASVTELGSYAFALCDSLSAVTLNASITAIPRGVFSGCISLTAIAIHEGVERIRVHAFVGCQSLVTVTFPTSVTIIDSHSFSDCHVLDAPSRKLIKKCSSVAPGVPSEL